MEKDLECSILIQNQLLQQMTCKNSVHTVHSVDRYELKCWLHDAKQMCMWVHSSLLDSVASNCFINKVSTKLYRPKDYEIALCGGYNSNSCE